MKLKANKILSIDNKGFYVCFIVLVSGYCVNVLLMVLSEIKFQSFYINRLIKNGIGSYIG